MKIDDIKSMSEVEIRSKMQDMRHESLNLRIQQQSGQLERPSRLREIRRTIARMQTDLRQRQNVKEQKAVKA